MKKLIVFILINLFVLANTVGAADYDDNKKGDGLNTAGAIDAADLILMMDPTDLDLIVTKDAQSIIDAGLAAPTGTIDISGATVTFGLDTGDLPSSGTWDASGLALTLPSGFLTTSSTWTGGDLTGTGLAPQIDETGVDHDGLANFVAAEHYRWDNDISGTATIHANNISDLSATYEVQLVNEAGLYGVLSDVTNFMQPGVVETITENWVNTANPWADNEVADALTIDQSSSGTLIVDQAADCSGVTAEGQFCWDTDDDILYSGDGAAATAVGAAGSISDTAYDITTWNAVTTIGASKNALRDYLALIDTDGDGDVDNVDSALGSGTVTTIELDGVVVDATVVVVDYEADDFDVTEPGEDNILVELDAQVPHLNVADTITANWVNTANPWDISTETNLAVTTNQLVLTDDTLSLADHDTARTAIGLAIGSDVQAYDANLDALDSGTISTWVVVYTDGSSAIQAAALGANGTFLESNGAAAAPAFRVLADTDIPDISATYEAVDAEITRADTADIIGADWLWADDIPQSFGTGDDWELAYDSTQVGMLWSTADTTAANAATPMYKILADSGDSGMTANQIVWALYRGTTALMTIDEDGDMVIAGSVEIGPTGGDSTIFFNDNGGGYTGSGAQFELYADVGILKWWDSSSEYTVVHEGTSPTWTGSHSYAGAEITLPSVDADAAGMISFDSTAWAATYGAAAIYGGAGNALGYVVAVDVDDTPSNGQVPKWNTGGLITWETDADSGGAPELQNVTDPQSDAEFESAADVNVNFLFSGVNTTGSMLQVEQTGASTGGNLFSVTQSGGSPTDGTLLSVTGDDADLTNSWFGDVGVAHGWRIYEASANVYTLDNVGSAVLNLDTLGDLLIGGTAFTGQNWVMALDYAIQFGDAAVYIESDDDGYLDIVADAGLRVSGGIVTVGSATVDAGAVTMIRGAQTGDPQVQWYLSADDSGDFYMQVDTGGMVYQTDAQDEDIAFVSFDGGATAAEARTIKLDASESELLVGVDSTHAVDLIVSGKILGMTSTVLKTAAYTVGTDDADETSGTVFVNNDDDAQTWTLDTAAAGKAMCFFQGSGVTAAVTVTPGASDKLLKDGVAGTAATAYTSSGTGADALCVVAIDAEYWLITRESGTWSE